jgi:hypothetical protein
MARVSLGNLAFGAAARSSLRQFSMLTRTVENCFPVNLESQE